MQKFLKLNLVNLQQTSLFLLTNEMCISKSGTAKIIFCFIDAYTM